VPLFGTFDTMQLTDVLQWISETKNSGRLIVNIDADETHLLFNTGELQGISSGNSLRLDFGQYLFSKSLITEDKFKELLKVKSFSNRVELLVNHNILNEKEIIKYQRQYAFDIVLNLFFFNDGSFHFSNKNNSLNILSDDSNDFIFIKTVSTLNILMNAMRRLDEWQRIKEVFPSPFTVVTLKAPLSENSNNIILNNLQNLETSISIGDLSLQLDTNKFDVYKSLYQLYKDGKIKIDEMNPGKANFEHLGPIEDLVENAKILIAEHQFEEAREVLSTVISISPDNRETITLMRTLRSQYLAYLYEQIPPHKTPLLKISRAFIKTKKLSSKEQYLAERINGKWDVGMLVVATPLGELDTLRSLKKLIHAGIIYLS